MTDRQQRPTPTDAHRILHDPVAEAITNLAHQESGRVLALLARRFGDLDLADDAVQEALIEAAQHWPKTGIPQNPAGWLLSVARRKAIDAIRRKDSQLRRAKDLAQTIDPSEAGGEPPDLERGNMIDDTDTDNRIPDERLRLMFLCCHPALDQDAQVALTLRLVAGLTTAEIAAGFMVPEATLAQRIVRAKNKIRIAGIPMTIPTSLPSRIDAILSILYLTFNESYVSRSKTAESLQRIDLADEVLRLTEVVAALLPNHPEANGLLAMQLFHQARSSSRTDGRGDLVLLADQDRSTWDLDSVKRGNTSLATALRQMQPGVFQLQALIASKHANARTAVDTDWPSIAAIYQQLVAMTGSPVVALNHAVAVGFADGPQSGLSMVDEVKELDGYHLFHSTRADFLRRLNRNEEALSAYQRAMGLTENASERRFLQGRIESLS
jgi:RNA polymerase sigma-70 factor, ECF subfamily